MERREYQRLRQYSRSYWWHVGKRALLRSVLDHAVPADPARPALDVGCGAGDNFEMLAPFGRFFGSEVTGELWESGIERPVRPVLLAEGAALPFADGSLGLCTFFDVLEHVEPEDAFLGEVHRVLQPGGRVLVSVPAYMFLWSEHDVSLHHHRRYVRGTLKDALARNGFRVLRCTYGFAGILPAVAAYRVLGRWFRRKGDPSSSYVAMPEPLNRLLIGWIRAEAEWLRHADLPFGTSVIALARKEGP
jgi:SAM-dependent methyltransferase